MSGTCGQREIKQSNETMLLNKYHLKHIEVLFVLPKLTVLYRRGRNSNYKYGKQLFVRLFNFLICRDVFCVLARIRRLANRVCQFIRDEVN